MFLKSLKACVLILLIVSVILSSASCHDAYNDEYERKLADLIYQRQMLINEKNSLDSEMEKSLGNLSYMSFVFTELDSVLYTDVYPKMFSGDDEIDIEAIKSTVANFKDVTLLNDEGTLVAEVMCEVYVEYTPEQQDLGYPEAGYETRTQYIPLVAKEIEK